MFKYSLEDNGTSFTIRNGCQEFNRGTRRGDIILVTGDKPRFAMMTTYREDKFDPDLIKLGDGRIFIRIGDTGDWLDNMENNETHFRPWGAEYCVTDSGFIGIEMKLLISHAGEQGIAAKLSLKNKSTDSIHIGAEFFYGGLRRCGRTMEAPYFHADNNDGAGNDISAANHAIEIRSGDIPSRVYVDSYPAALPEICCGRAKYTFQFTIPAGGEESVFLTVSHCLDAGRTGGCINSNNPQMYIDESKQYYDNLLEQAVIQTPVELINAGFRTAVLNMDYIYAKPAWFEGIHWWSSYICNNYQISAAISLGQIQKAGEALVFLGLSERGPCPPLYASGKPCKREFINDDGDPYGQFDNEDGLPYYIYQLCQYFEHTGDKAPVEAVWPGLMTSLDRLWKVRDGNGSLLLDWHLSCNCFMYQADHLGMPGDAASPSLMIAGMLEKLASVAENLEKYQDADKFRKLSGEMNKKIVEILWNEKEGCFYNHIDLQGLTHMAHYYTDLVFPVLYTSLPECYGQKSLEHLNGTQWTENIFGEKVLMRIGELKPSIFGNDNVMPVQMAEAARAYFKTGDFDRGVKLLKSVALASTVFTDAPGNFPERMSDRGKGECNYIFGNPAGAFAYSVINGLFGISLTQNGKVINVEPSFPDEWEDASLRLSYVSLVFKAGLIDTVKTRKYVIKNNVERELIFTLLLEPCRIEKVLCNGKPAVYNVSPSYGKYRLDIIADYAIVHELFIESIPEARPVLSERECISEEPDAALEPNGKEFCSEAEKPSEYEFFTLNLESLYNSETITYCSAWRTHKLHINMDAYCSGGFIKAGGCTFNLPSSEKNIILLECGFSHSYTRKTYPSLMPGSIEIPVNKMTSAVYMLYATEVESRHTGCRVGAIDLCYDNGSVCSFPLTVGKNIDTLVSHFAEETIPVKINEYDFIHVLKLKSSPWDVMEKLIIRLDVPDVQFGLMGMTLVSI